MINLRFHIVSIVAVFLALAVGIFTGTTLLDRVTVDYLKASRDRVDERNDELETEQEQLLTIVEKFDSQMEDFDAQVVDTAFEGELDGVEVLIVAADGVDPNGVRSVQDTYVSAGASSYGIIWLDERLDLANRARLADVAEAIGVESPGSTEDLRTAVQYSLGVSLALAATPVGGIAPSGESEIEQEEPAESPESSTVSDDPLGEVFEPAFEPIASETALYWSELSDAGLLDWDSPDGSPTSAILPGEGLRIVMISNQNPVLDNEMLMYPMINQVSASGHPLIVGELRVAVPSAEDADLEFPRGGFVNPIRGDETLSETVVTVDNLDKPFGRVASLMVLAGVSDARGGSYGEAVTADRSFPAVAQTDG